MRRFAIAGFVTVAMSLPFLGGTVESYASEGPWCHTFGGAQESIENCGIQTLEKCRFEIQGNGGSCSPNPYYHGSQPQRRTAPAWWALSVAAEVRWFSSAIDAAHARNSN
jgi:hypothetical protein